jgi:isopentenyldiphosphate isomerase
MNDELLKLVDESGNPIGTAPRSTCHGDPSLLHAVAHAMVVNRAGEVLLQLRSASKDVCPGLWDTSVGGHLLPDEDAAAGILRETGEELGIVGEPTCLHSYIWRGRRESEYVTTFLIRHEGPFHPDSGEIDAIRFWPSHAIDSALGTGVFTPNFEEEWRLFGSNQ